MRVFGLLKREIIHRQPTSPEPHTGGKVNRSKRIHSNSPMDRLY